MMLLPFRGEYSSKPMMNQWFRTPTALMTVVIFLLTFVMSTQAQTTLVILQNTLSLYNGDNITLTTSNVVATENSLNAPPRVVYSVVPGTLSNGQFFLFNNLTGLYAPTNSFTQQELADGFVRFSHPGNQQIPTYSLHASDLLLNAASPNSTASIFFTAFRRGTIGAPRPIFEASVDPQTLIVTLRITMFKRVFDSPEANFNLGLSSLMACQQSDLIRDNFTLVTSTNWYNTYQFSTPLSRYLSNPNVQQVSSGGVIDLVTTMFADYMITRLTPTTSTGGDIYVVPSQSGTCYQVIYTQKYILTLTLAVTRVNFNSSNPNSFLQPKKIFINDLGRLEIRLIVYTTVSETITSWSVSGPYAFNVTDAVFTGSSNGFNYYLVVLQSNVINSEVDFYGDYVLSFRTISGQVNTIPYSLQYLVPYPPIEQVLLFDTQAQTFSNAALSTPRTQFTPTDTVFVKVDAPTSPVLAGFQLSPYNVILCCFQNFANIPVNVDCRNASRSGDFSDEIFINGVAERAGGIDAGVLPPPTTQSYGFQFGFPLAIRNDVDRRCFLTIETAYTPRNTSTRSMMESFSTEAVTADAPIPNKVASVTYRVFDVIPNNKNGNGNGGVNNAAVSYFKQGVSMMMTMVAAIMVTVFVSVVLGM
ncbi:hypothetical protein FDP41_004003 [Naegleria fowleri]|uniref:Uncharacterized protein n=1 Tax=Naegleria fowleri TaxID=5763 RepID=A0A6A5BR84_NAEFO|nr:uncharacterized protein FDP41_004003 [Naegleria fowleri]KAF0976708.1 hypothetical protein FDP41_004003 [Naegleria fowleri]CAG4714434.1 unnamed protein product [Naegleria fowleri]